MLVLQARALVALGRIEEFRAVWNEIESAPDAPAVAAGSLGMLLWPVELLGFYGHADAESEFAERLADWYAARPNAEKTSPGYQLQYGRALLLAGRLREARGILDALKDNDPDDMDIRGVRGVIAQEVLSAQVTQAPDPVTRYRDEVAPPLEQLVMKCLKKKAADRWQSAEELLPQLEALATPSGVVTPTGMMRGVFFPPPTPPAALASGLHSRHARLETAQHQGQ
jgi:hypothetical protein